MKTSMTKKTFTQSLMLFASVLTLTVITACGKNGGDSAPPPVVTPTGPIYGSCATCGPNSQLIASAAGYTYFAGQTESNINLEFYGTGLTQTQQYPQQQQYYSGSVSAQGTIHWRGQQSLMCGMGPGVYTLTTTQAGTWNGRNVYGMVMQAVGPTSVTIYVDGSVGAATPAILGDDGRQYPYSFMGRLRIVPNSGGNPYYYGGGCELYPY